MEWKRRNRLLLSSFLGLSLLACGGGTPGGSGSTKCSGLNAGDIIITEIMANPKGPDGYQEYVEIYNPTSNPIELNGVKVFISKDDGSNEKSKVTLKDATIQPGQYFTIGDFSDAVDEETGIAPTPYSHLDYTISKTFSITNSNARIGLRCSETILDEVIWSSSKEGRALILSGDKLNAVDHSSATNWCSIPAEDIYSIPGLTKTDENGKVTTSYGTPRQSNPDCASEEIEVTVDAGTCLENGVARPINYPAVGDLVINEIMTYVTDNSKEYKYLELYANSAVDLNELIVQRGSYSWPISSNDCLTTSAGQYILIATTDDETQNGGLPQVDVVLSKMDLTQSGELKLIIDNSTEEAPAEPVEIDSVSYVKASQQNHSVQRSSDMSDNFCESMSSYSSIDVIETADDGSTVTNTISMYGTPGSANAECPKQAEEGQCLDNGVPRDIVMPEAGELLITEVMVKPNGEDVAKWFEVYAKANVDLNGLIIKKGTAAKTYPISSNECIALARGNYAVVATTEDANLTAETVVVPSGSFSLNTGSNRNVTLLNANGVTVDSYDYASPTEGVSLQLSASTLSSSRDEISDANYCVSTGAAYDSNGNVGTPGSANSECPAQAGDGQCMDNGTPRDIVMPAEGDLLITEVMAKPNGDGVAKWFEIYAKADVDLNGLIIKKGTAATTYKIASTECISLTRGDYAVVATAEDASLTAETVVIPSGSFSLNTSSNRNITLLNANEVLIDSYDYASPTAGVSLQLSASMLTAAREEISDANYCASTASAYDSNGNIGTPGTANAQCAAQ